MRVLSPFPNFLPFLSFYSTLRQYRVTLSCWESGLPSSSISLFHFQSKSGTLPFPLKIGSIIAFHTTLVSIIVYIHPYWFQHSNFPKTLVKMYNDFVLTSLLVGAAAQSPDLLFNPQRQRMREPIHVKDDLYPIMCDVCELVAFSVYFDTMEKLKVRHQ